MKNLNIPLSWQIVLAAIVAVIIGRLFPAVSGFAGEIAESYMRLLMLLIPYFVCAVVSAFTSSDDKGFSLRITLKTLTGFVGMEIIAGSTALLVANIFFANTNIEAIFDLVLKTAVDNNLAQEEIPGLVIFSDMEFDYAVCYPDENLFKAIARKWAAKGYRLPKLYFWNINSRTNTIPMQENDLGVGLISGFSQSIMDMFLSNKTDPYDIIVEKLTSERYAPVLQAVGYYDPASAQ